MATERSNPSAFSDFPSDIDGPDFDDDAGSPLARSESSGGFFAASTAEQNFSGSPINPTGLFPQVDDQEAADIRGFFVAEGEGQNPYAEVGGEPLASYFVDVQDYETGALQRVWGAALGEVMSAARAELQLQPGSRVHLAQRGKREMVFSSVDGENAMVNRVDLAKDWTCIADRAPLPSQIAPLIAGLNVDAMLDRLALRHDMALDDPQLPVWKKGQMRIIQAFGDDPQTIKSFFEKNSVFSSEEERALIAQALALEGLNPNDQIQFKRESEARLSALRSMAPTARFDYLIETAKPHLLHANKEKAAQLSHEVVDAIDSLTAMALPSEAHDSAPRKAMRSALSQSVDGLTLPQQLDFLTRRRALVLTQRLSAPLANDAEPSLEELARHALIDASEMSRDEYIEALNLKLETALSNEDRTAMLRGEVEARQQLSAAAEARLKPVSDLSDYLQSGSDASVTAYAIGRVVSGLADTLANGEFPRVKSLFERLGGIGGWRKQGCEDDLLAMTNALSAAKQAPVYQAFENDPKVRIACAGRDIGKVLAGHPEMAHTEAVLPHLHAQDSAEHSVSTPLTPVKGLWSKTMKSAHALSDRISHLSPEHLMKSGKLDTAWAERMQKGLAGFADQLHQTLMPEKIKKQFQDMLASMLLSIQTMLQVCRDLFSKPSRASAVEAASAPGM